MIDEKINKFNQQQQKKTQKQNVRTQKMYVKLIFTKEQATSSVTV